jgi:hypothetical protein
LPLVTVFVFIMGSTLGVCGAILHAIAASERWAAADRNKPRGV